MMYCMSRGIIVSPYREPRIRRSRSAPYGVIFCSCGFVFHIKTSPLSFTITALQCMALAVAVCSPDTVGVLLLECPRCVKRRFGTEPVFAKAISKIRVGRSVCPTDIATHSFLSPQRHVFFALKILDGVVLVGQNISGMMMFGSRSFPVPITALGDSHTVYIFNSRAVVVPVDCVSPERAWAAKQRYEALRSAALLTWKPASVAKPSRKRVRVTKRRACRTPSRAFLGDGASTTDRTIHHALTALPPGLLRYILEFV